MRHIPLVGIFNQFFWISNTPPDRDIGFSSTPLWQYMGDIICVKCTWISCFPVSQVHFYQRSSPTLWSTLHPHTHMSNRHFKIRSLISNVLFLQLNLWVPKLRILKCRWPSCGSRFGCGSWGHQRKSMRCSCSWGWFRTRKITAI